MINIYKLRVLIGVTGGVGKMRKLFRAYFYKSIVYFRLISKTLRNQPFISVTIISIPFCFKRFLITETLDEFE